MTQQQALASAFPRGAKITRQTFFLTKEQSASIGVKEQLVIRYVGELDRKIVGYAYFDRHLVRTLPETVMIVLTADGRIDHIDILAFDEPGEYLPKRRWIDQLRGRMLDNELSLNRAIRPLSGASLTAQAILNASRKILAIHRVIG